MVLDESFFCPTIDHFMRLLWIQHRDMINVYLKYVTEYHAFRDFLQEEFKFIQKKVHTDFSQVMNNHDDIFYMIENLSNLFIDRNISKRSRWTWKQLRRFQKTIGVPTLCKLVEEYVDMLEDQMFAMVNEEIDW
jgi:hypothetical protein